MSVFEYPFLPNKSLIYLQSIHFQTVAFFIFPYGNSENDIMKNAPQKLCLFTFDADLVKVCIYNAFDLFSDHFLFVPRLIFRKRSFPALNSKPASIAPNPLFANKTFGHFGVFLHLPLSLHRKLYISGTENT